MERNQELNFPNPVQDEKDLFFREEELNFLLQHLDNKKNKCVVIKGERLIGKTSLLKVFEKRINQHSNTFVITLPKCYNRNDLIKEFTSGISVALAKEKKSSPSLIDLSSSKMDTVVEMKTNIWPLLLGKSFVIVLDELDSMLVESFSQTNTNEMLDFFLYLIEQRDSPFQFLFTVTRFSHQILNLYTSPFLLNSEQVQLKPWTFEETCQVLSSFIPDIKISSFQESFFEYSGGHPYMVKVLLKSLLNNQKNHFSSSDDDKFLIKSSVEQILPSFGDTKQSMEIKSLSDMVNFSVENIFRRHFSEEEKKLLHAIVQTKGGLTEKELIQQGLLGKILKDLETRGYLQMQKNGTYIFRIKFLEEWLKITDFELI